MSVTGFEPATFWLFPLRLYVPPHAQVFCYRRFFLAIPLSDMAMATACLRLVTLPPEELLSLPDLYSLITRSIFFCPFFFFIFVLTLVVFLCILCANIHGRSLCDGETCSCHSSKSKGILLCQRCSLRGCCDEMAHKSFLCCIRTPSN